MENRYCMYSKGSSGWSSLMNEEFQEEDIRNDYSAGYSKFTSTTSSFKEEDPSIFLSKDIPTTSIMRTRTILKSNIQHSSSAPAANIPDWSKIYGKSNSINNSCSWLNDPNENDHDGLESDEEEEEDVIPPHAWIARKLARSQISSFSVCEGAGRTLKGRDLSRVRNAVLTKTGFLES